MNKIAISLIALSLMASGAFASQRNNDEPNTRIFTTSAASDTSPLAVASNDVAGSAFAALTKRANERMNGDDNN